jgi:1,4-dihydroxy-2-naphthoate octaprenyltransferase
LFSEVVEGEFSCGDPVNWWQTTAIVAAVSAVVAVTCGLAIAVAAPRWRTVLTGTAVAFVGAAVLFAGVSFAAVANPPRRRGGGV